MDYINETVLWVDDDTKFLASVKRLLGKNYSVVTAQNAREGFDVLRGNDSVALVISDLKMSEMDGITFLARVKETAPDIIRILFTGYANLENAMAAVNSGHVFRILTKPCSDEDIRNAVEAGLEQSRLLIGEPGHGVFFQRTGGPEKGQGDSREFIQAYGHSSLHHRPGRECAGRGRLAEHMYGFP